MRIRPVGVSGVVCVRLPADYDLSCSTPRPTACLSRVDRWRLPLTCLFYADVETTWPASTTMVALYVAFVVGTFVCHRIFPGFVGEESASATLPTHALPLTPTAIVASQSRAVGGYQGGGAGGHQAAVRSRSGRRWVRARGWQWRAAGALPPTPLPSRRSSLPSKPPVPYRKTMLDANRALATLLAHGGSSSALPPTPQGHLLSPPPRLRLCPRRQRPEAHRRRRSRSSSRIFGHTSPRCCCSHRHCHSRLQATFAHPTRRPQGRMAQLPGKGHGEGLGVGDTPLVSDRLSRRMEALFELLAAPPRSLFRLTVPDPNIALAALGGGRPGPSRRHLHRVYAVSLLLMVGLARHLPLGVRKNPRRHGVARPPASQTCSRR